MHGFLVETKRRASSGAAGYRNGFLTSMAANQDEASDIKSDDIIAFVLGEADEKTARRVAAAALARASVRERVAQARFLTSAAKNAAEAAFSADEEGADFARRAELLRERMMKTVVSATLLDASEALAPSPASKPVADAVVALARLARGHGGILYRAGVSAVREFTEALNGGGAAGSQTLLTGRHRLTLPCLAPATASAAGAAAHVQRQTVTTGDGVRIEFQQLPGAEPPRLRVFVDASSLNEANADPAYNVAYLTVEEGSGVGAPVAAASVYVNGASTPDRHIFVIMLNREGRGFTEVSVGGVLNADAALPAPRGACHLIGATLAQWSPEVGEASRDGETLGDDQDGGSASPTSRL